jgi:hypothetical protein
VPSDSEGRRRAPNMVGSLYVGVFNEERGQVVLQHCMHIVRGIAQEQRRLPSYQAAPWRRLYVDFVQQYTRDRESPLEVRPPSAQEIQRRVCEVLAESWLTRPDETRAAKDGMRTMQERIECMDCIRRAFARIHAEETDHPGDLSDQPVETPHQAGFAVESVSSHHRDLRDVSVAALTRRDQQRQSRGLSPPPIRPEDSASNVVGPKARTAAEREHGRPTRRYRPSGEHRMMGEQRDRPGDVESSVVVSIVRERTDDDGDAPARRTAASRDHGDDESTITLNSERRLEELRPHVKRVSSS